MPPEGRAQSKFWTEVEGGGDPTTVCMVTYLSRKVGPVYVFRDKLPTFLDTRDMRFCEILVATKDRRPGLRHDGAERLPGAALGFARSREDQGAVRRGGGPENWLYFWMMDANTVYRGDNALFGGIESRWAAGQEPTLLKTGAKGSTPSTVFTPKKARNTVYSKGKPV
jgi:hypothetical protein